jgi:glycosyltransferase involved in cell wall biosynthesis
VAVVQLVLTHYNYPLYQRLSERFRGNVCFVVGDRFFRGSPVSIATKGLWRHDVTNSFVANRLVWQGPLPKVVFDSTVAILELNPRILSNWYAAWRRRRRGLATVWWGHGLSRRKAAGAWSRALRRAFIRGADAVVVYDERSRRELIELGVTADKLFVAPNSIDVDAAARLAGDHEPGERRHILFIGRLVREKKIELLLEAFAIAVGGLPTGTCLLIVGDGPEKHQLQARADALGVTERVRFLGEIHDEETVAPVFGRSIVVAHPSAIGLAAIHSLAYGVPVLFAQGEEHGPEVEVLIPGTNSDTFRADDARDLARQLVAMTTRPGDMRQMGRSGMAAMQKAFGVERMADVFERAIFYAAGACRHR